MINWQDFETSYEMGEFWSAMAIVSQGVDGVAVEGTPHVLRCKSCDADVAGAEKIVGARCEKCSAENALRWVCRNHPTSYGFDLEACPCCQRGLRPLNGASPERVDKVVEVCNEVDMLESKGALFEELKAAFRSGDEERAAEIFESGELAGWRGAEQLVGLALDSRRVIVILKELATARRDDDYFSLVDIWDRNRKVLVVRTSAEEFRDLAEDWRAKNEGARQILDAWRRKPVDDQVLMKLWEVWRDRVSDHPEILPVRQEVEHRVERQTRWVRFAEVEHASRQQVDQMRVSLWHDELFEDWEPAQLVAGDVAAAQGRLKILGTIRQTLAGTDDGAQSGRDRVQRLDQLGGELPPDYEYDDRDSVRLAGRQFDMLLQLEGLIREASSDLALAAAWRSLSELEGDGLLEDAGDQQMTQLALQREELIRQVQSIPVSELDVRECDRQLLEAWPALLDGCPDLQDIQARCIQARSRHQLLDALESAIADNDVPRIAELGAEPLLEGWPYSEQQRVSLDTAERELRCLEEIEAVVDRGDAERFAAIFDADLFRRHQDRESLVARRDRIIELATTAVIPNAGNGTSKAFVGGVKRNATGAVRVRWAWPDPRVSDRCRLRVCPESPEGNGQPATETWLFEQIVPRSVVEVGDGYQPLPFQDDWVGCQIVVQCLIDLGFATLEGQPLVLGVFGRDAGSAM